MRKSVAIGICIARRSAADSYAIAMHGEPAMPDGFTALPYANPDAPKGGRLVQGVLGTFDSLNPFIVKGLAVQAIRGYVVESLMARGYDEPFTLYGLLARTVETDDARSYVTFALDPAAHFSDGTPVTADDVIFSWQLLRDHGRPNHRTYYSKVAKAEALDERTVRFDLAGSNDRELPLILGLMPVLPKHAIDVATFEELDACQADRQRPLRRRAMSMPARASRFKRDPNYWGRELPINRGLWNFDELRFDYYRDANAYFEAFKAGLYDVRTENDPGRWQTGYDFPAVRDGRVVKEAFPDGLPKISSDFVFNTRRAALRRHPRARGDRAAVRLRMDQPQFLLRSVPAQRELFRRLRIVGAIAGRPTTRERALLGAVSRRGARRRARRHLVAAGQRRLRPRPHHLARSARAVRRRRLRAQRHRAARTRQRQAAQPSKSWSTSRDEERLALAFASNLARAGIDGAACALVDAVQYEQRGASLRFRHDPVSLGPIAVARQRADASTGARPPPTEQGIAQLHGRAEPGGRRHDRRLAAARASAPDFVAAVRALDRVLISGILRGAAVLSAAAMGGALDLRSRIRRARRCSAICRKPGGANRSGSLQ